jgi:hypothetical protein
MGSAGSERVRGDAEAEQAAARLTQRVGRLRDAVDALAG